MNFTNLKVRKAQLLLACILILPLAAVSQHIASEAKQVGTFNGVGLTIASPTVPPGGLLQMQIMLTEPKPILKGRQGVKFVSSGARAAVATTFANPVATLTSEAVPAVTAGSLLGPIRDVALFGPDGNVSGVAVAAQQGLQVYFRSTLKTFGTNIDAPVISVSMPVNIQSSIGQTVNLNLDPNATQWFDPTAAQYPIELKSGTMTVGGSLSISDVIPGGGLVPAGKTIVIKGTGFDSKTTVQINEGTVATTQFVSSNQINISLTTAFNPSGKRVRVINKGHELATYFPSSRTTLFGKSTHNLVAESYPIFPDTRWTAAYFRTAQSGNVFTGLALQNPNVAAASVHLQLRTLTGTVLSTRALVLAGNTHIVRDLAELFPTGMNLNGLSLKVISSLPLQMLGLRGDDASSIVLPVDPSLVP